METQEFVSSDGDVAKKCIAPEFGSWPLTDREKEIIEHTRWAFDALQEHIAAHTPPSNMRYLAIVRTKLEEACMFAVKGIARKP
jgi:hypothetical protein